MNAKDAGSGLQGAGANHSAADWSGGVNLVTAPGAGKTLVVDDLILSPQADAVVTISDGTVTLLGPIYVAGGTVAQLTLRGALRAQTANGPIVVTTSAAVQMTAYCSYHAE